MKIFMVLSRAAGRSMVSVLVLMCFVDSRDVRAESPPGSCVPNCVSVLDLAGPKAVADMRGLADLARERVQAAERGKDRLEIFNRFFFDGMRFEAVDNLESRDVLLPNDVLANHRGTCVGLTGLYLALSAMLDLPVAAVSVPNHMFVRFDDGRDRINVELLQAGKAFDDEWYRSHHKIPASSISSGVFLRGLSEREFLGYVYANLGVIYSRVGDYGNSRVLYEAALENAPRLPVAYYSLGNDLLGQHSYREAIQAFDKALDLYPTDIMALNNRGIAYCKLGKGRQARRDFQAAIDLDPTFALPRTNLADQHCSRSKKENQ